MATPKKNPPPAKDLPSLFDQLERIKGELDFEAWEECFYRGEPSAHYDLLPSLLRKPYATDEDIWWTESGLFYEFSTRAKILHQSSHDDWDVLFYMRHYGAPTRLIDWTETLSVALYFAISGAKPNTSVGLWLLNPYRLNEITWEVRDLISPKYLLNPYDLDGYNYSDFLEDPESFKIKYPVAIYPPQKSDRMLAQRGWFTFHGTVTAAINKIPKLASCYRRIEILPDLIGPIRTFLNHAGINDYTMFPDLDGLSRYLKQKYEFTTP